MFFGSGGSLSWQFGQAPLLLKISDLSQAKWTTVDAISALSPPRLRNILAYFANEAESEERLRTIITLIKLPAFTDENFPERNFTCLTKGAVEDLSHRETQNDQSHGDIACEPVLATTVGPEASGRKETREPTRRDTQGTEAESEDAGGGPTGDVKSGKRTLADGEELSTKGLRMSWDEFYLIDLRDRSLPSLGGFRVDLLESANELVLYLSVPRQICSSRKVRSRPLTSILRIFTGGRGCKKIMLLKTRDSDPTLQRMLLKLRSDTEACDFTKRLQALPYGKPDFVTKDRQVATRAVNLLCRLT